MKTISLTVSIFILMFQSLYAQPLRQTTLLDEDWAFALGNAADPAKDFGHGTEYFNYFTKAASIHNTGPYSDKFDASAWKRVNLPHDWVVDLPFAPEASHSHGYKTVGYKYPANSVGWYRKSFRVEEAELGKHFVLQFDGIFRNATVWVNGFYMGHEPSGYATQTYDITDYLNYGGDNLICVRADATFEEGWFYEGAGIYRHVWLYRMAPLHVATFGTFVQTLLEAPFDKAMLDIETKVENSGLTSDVCSVRQTLCDAAGKEVATATVEGGTVLAKETKAVRQTLAVSNPSLWSLETPYLYTLRTDILTDGKVCDSYVTAVGIRHIRFDADEGFFLNGKRIELRGVNMHQDHAGVGSAIPDALYEYRIERLKSMGCNAYRSSHNPMAPALLDICDRMGMLVIEENRLMGVNREHRRELEQMIVRDRNHPSVILWSLGNEEWGIEGNVKGIRVAATMREWCHRIDPSREVTAALSGGGELLKSLDVVGYNYLIQNRIEDFRRLYPAWRAFGSEETTGSGTRGVYFTDSDRGLMASINRTGDKQGVVNVIERGWRYYHNRPWLAGICYWTGFDYRGEPTPMSFPATGSQKGLFDYCGFEKDEVWYLRAWWTDKPVIHLMPHWNLRGHEGDSIALWVYSNCDEVQLIVNGKKMKRKHIERDAYLSWPVVYRPGTVEAVGYKNGKRVISERIVTTGEAVTVALSANRTTMKADNSDVAVVRVDLHDAAGRFVPDACVPLQITIEGPGRILGVGNGNPAWQDKERPTETEARSFEMKSFNGLAQILVQSGREEGEVRLKVNGEILELKIKN